MGRNPTFEIAVIPPDTAGYRSFFGPEPDDNVEQFPSARDAVPEPATGRLTVADFSWYSCALEEKPAAK
jgi:hypothetical protein